MKITIERGESVEKALEYLTEILLEKSSEYPFLKSNMNIYLSLNNARNFNCPENEKEYLISKGNLIDVEDLEKEQVYRDAFVRWDSHINYCQHQIDYLRKDIQLDLNYLDSAEEKGRRPENIEKRKILLKEHEDSLAKALEQMQLIRKLDIALKENNFTTYFEKLYYKHTKYKYIIHCYFIFENIDGFTGYFDGSCIKKGQLE